jgi:hypothetical protein
VATDLLLAVWPSYPQLDKENRLIDLNFGEKVALVTAARRGIGIGILSGFSWQSIRLLARLEGKPQGPHTPRNHELSSNPVSVDLRHPHATSVVMERGFRQSHHQLRNPACNTNPADFFS